MPTHVLIDNVKLKFLKAAATVKQLEAWAEVLCPKNDFRIQGILKKDFSVYSEADLKQIIRNASGATRVRGDYTAVVAQAHALMMDMEDDPLPVDEILKKKRKGRAAKAGKTATAPTGEAKPGTMYDPDKKAWVPIPEEYKAKPDARNGGGMFDGIKKTSAVDDALDKAAGAFEQFGKAVGALSPTPHDPADHGGTPHDDDVAIPLHDNPPPAPAPVADVPMLISVYSLDDLRQQIVHDDIYRYLTA